MSLILKPRIHRFLSAEIFDTLAGGLFMMALPWQMLKQGVAGSTVALIALLCTVLSFFMTPVFATLIDRHSRKALLVISQAAKAFAALLLALAAYYEQAGLLVMTFAQVIFWLCGNLAWTTSNAFQQENYRPSEYAGLSSYLEIIMQGSTVLAAGLGVYLLETWNLFAFSVFALGCASAAALLYFSIPYTRLTREHKPQHFFADMAHSVTLFKKRRQFMLFVTLSCLAYPMLTYLGKLLPVYFHEQDLSGSWVASWSLFYSSGAILCGISVPFLFKRFAYQKLMLVGMGMMTVIMATMNFVSIGPLLLFLFVAIGLFAPMIRIARKNWMNEVIPAYERGRTEGSLAIFSALAQSLSYVLIAVLAHYGAIPYGFIAFAIVMALALAGMLQLNPGKDSKSPKDQEPPTAVITA